MGIPCVLRQGLPPLDYGWHLKQNNNTLFTTVPKDNGQFAVILNHPIIRGVTTEMLRWWFQRFLSLKVKLYNVPGVEDGRVVPAYFLWHPQDHIGVKAVSGTDENGFMTKGTVAALAEAMDSEKYGYKYLMDSSLNIIELEQDQGLFMGQDFPIFGPMVRARICWKQLPGGVMYHYEIAVGLNEHAGYSSFLKRILNGQAQKTFSEPLFKAWHRHNTIEVGTFENFLPSLWKQRDPTDHFKTLTFDALTMNAASSYPQQQMPADATLFHERVKLYQESNDLVHDVIIANPAMVKGEKAKP